VNETPSAAALAVTLPAAQLARLSQGWAYIFWGVLALSGSMLDLLLTTPRIWHGAVFSIGLAGVVAGSWALTQAPGLGRDWQRATRDLLLVGVLVAYLTPFMWMWRQMSGSRYLFGHALAWAGLMQVYLILLNTCLRVFGRQVGDRALVWQAAVFTGIAYLLFAGPFAWLAWNMARAVQDDSDPLAYLQFVLYQVRAWQLFLVLTPVPLTLSLVWSAKAWALDRLFAEPPARLGD
jgi:hypothetical protein